MSHVNMVVDGFGGLVPQGEANGNVLFGLRIVIVEIHRDHSKENRNPSQSPGDFLVKTQHSLSPEEEKYREFYDPCYECPWWRPECEVGEPPDECPQKEDQEEEDAEYWEIY
jgi:hypothetical protein